MRPPTATLQNPSLARCTQYRHHAIGMSLRADFSNRYRCTHKRGSCSQEVGDLRTTAALLRASSSARENCLWHIFLDVFRTRSSLQGQQQSANLAVGDSHRILVLLLSLLHACPVLQGPGAFCNTVLIAEFHPSRSFASPPAWHTFHPLGGLPGAPHPSILLNIIWRGSLSGWNFGLAY
jgi:hypothetical protein